MATVTGLTAARMLAIEAASVIDGDVVGDNLILTKHDGSTINAGSVRGATGAAGPAGSDLVVLSAQSILDVGMAGQIRAGRQLTAADFTAMGLSVPVGLWNLSDVSDASGNGRTLVNRGALPFTSGINGLANTAARFAGSTTQGLYILDTGAADPFRIKAGSVGCWMRTAKRSTNQALVTKLNSATPISYWLYITGNNAEFGISSAGTWNTPGTDYQSIFSQSLVTDDRWHFIVGTADGTMIRMYVDGVYEGYVPFAGRIFQGAAALNIGSDNLTASVAGVDPFFGVIDEVFITSDVLTEDQIRNLYCAKIAHTLGTTPKRASINVRRLRKGAALVVGDFPTTPKRLYNFTAGSLSNEGSDANGTAGTSATLANNGTAVSVPGVGGLPDNAYNFTPNQSLSATDTGLPSGTGSWSFGQWFKTVITNATIAIAYWGFSSPNYGVMHLIQPIGTLISRNMGSDILGPFVADGEWHFVVTTADNAAVDGVKRKFYVDGKLIDGSTTLNSITLGGSNQHKIGSGNLATDLPFTGQIDTSFVCNYALTPEQIMALYLKGTQSLGVSPKNAGDHIEQLNTANMLCVFDSLEMQHQIDLAVG